VRASAKLPMIRALRLYDIPALTRLLEEPLSGSLRGLDQASGLSASSLVTALLPRCLAPTPVRRRIFVDMRDMRPRGFLHLVRRPGGHRWEVIHLCHDGSGDVSQECAALLEFGCSAAAAEGATKITTRVREDDDRQTIFNDAGFRKYAQETVLVLSGPPTLSERGPVPATRPFVAGDQWRLHRIYTATTPQGVQFVENLTSDEHLFPLRGSILSNLMGMRVTMEVIEAGPDLVAAIALVVHRPHHVAELHIKMKPEATVEVVRLLQRRLHQLGKEEVRNVVTTVRHYELDTLRVVRQLGFTPGYSRSILVKHTAAYVSEPRPLRAMDHATPALSVVHNPRPVLKPVECRDSRDLSRSHAGDPVVSHVNASPLV